MRPSPVPALRGLALALACATLSAEAQAPVDLRVALVIGNAAYTAAPAPP